MQNRPKGAWCVEDAAKSVAPRTVGFRPAVEYDAQRHRAMTPVDAKSFKSRKLLADNSRAIWELGLAQAVSPELFLRETMAVLKDTA